MYINLPSSFPEMKENIIGCFYDCDETLTPGAMQEPLFRHYGIDGSAFWQEKDKLIEHARRNGVAMDFENGYLNFMLDYVRDGRMPGLSNQKLRELGAEIKVFPGLPDFFARTKELIEGTRLYAEHGIKVEHYIVTTGLKEMVAGSVLNTKDLAGIFGSEFYEHEGVISRIARAVGHMKKTDFLHIANKGGNVNPTIDVNKRMPDAERRIPFRNMKYVGDGFTDVPCFSTIGDRGGDTYGVYGSLTAKAQAETLLLERRVKAIAPADYRSESRFYELFARDLLQTADAMVRDIQEK